MFDPRVFVNGTEVERAKRRGMVVGPDSRKDLASDRVVVLVLALHGSAGWESWPASDLTVVEPKVTIPAYEVDRAAAEQRAAVLRGFGPSTLDALTAASVVERRHFLATMDALAEQEQTDGE